MRAMIQKKTCEACSNTFPWRTDMKGIYRSYCPGCRGIAFESVDDVYDPVERHIMTYFVGIYSMPMTIEQMHDEKIHHRLDISRREFDDAFYSARKSMTALIKNYLLTAQKAHKQ